jgi:hypothetical protein
MKEVQIFLKNESEETIIKNIIEENYTANGWCIRQVHRFPNTYSCYIVTVLDEQSAFNLGYLFSKQIKSWQIS